MYCNVMLLEPFILGFKEEYTIMREDLNTKIDEMSLNIQSLKIFNKIYVIAFLVYWFGFFIYFDFFRASTSKKN